MKLLIIQMNNNIKGLDRRLNTIDRIISKANNPDLVLLPSLCTTSFLTNDVLVRYLDKENGLAFRFVKDMGSKYNILIGIGFPEINGGVIFNSYILGNENKVFPIIRENNSLNSLFKKGFYNHVIKTNTKNIYVSIGNDINLITINKEDNIDFILIADYNYQINNEEIKNKLKQIYDIYNIPVIFCTNNIKEKDEVSYKNANIIIVNKDEIIESFNESIEIEI